jgi:hypothetical protein
MKDSESLATILGSLKSSKIPSQCAIISKQLRSLLSVRESFEAGLAVGHLTDLQSCLDYQIIVSFLFTRLPLHIS